MMVPRDRAVRDGRTTESGLRDSRTRSGREWPGNRLYSMIEKCTRRKPRESGANLTARSKIRMLYQILNSWWSEMDSNQRYL